MSSKKIRVGTSGWTFPPWRGKFYPKGLVQKKELTYSAEKFSTLEINATFYGLQKPATFQNWFSQTPEDFVFAVKGSQYITHVHRLKEVKEYLATFLGSGLLCLKQKLGPILWQFPPNFTLKDDRVGRFVEMLPRDFKSAAKLAEKHGYKGKEGFQYTEVDKNFPLRHAFEFRHESWENADFIKLARKQNVALVLAHGGVPFFEEPTADFIYARMYGDGPAYKKGYPEKEIARWAKQFKTWAKNKDAFIYFGTENKVYAPLDALALIKKLSGSKP